MKVKLVKSTQWNVSVESHHERLFVSSSVCFVFFLSIFTRMRANSAYLKTDTFKWNVISWYSGFSKPYVLQILQQCTHCTHTKSRRKKKHSQRERDIFCKSSFARAAQRAMFYMSTSPCLWTRLHAKSAMCFAHLQTISVCVCVGFSSSSSFNSLIVRLVHVYMLECFFNDIV